MKLAYFADLHLMSRTPKYRVEGFFIEDVVEPKLQQIVKICKDCDYVLIGGDIFDRHDPSYPILKVAIKYFKKLPPKKIIIGNHDTDGLSLDELKHCAIGSMLESFGDDMEMVNGLINFDDIVYLRGICYRTEIVLDSYGDAYDTVGGDDYLIVMNHDPIVPKELNLPFLTIPATDIKTNADLVLCSHIHVPFNVKVGKTTFYNGGCIIRTNTTERMLVPKVLIIDTSKKILTEKYLDCNKEAFDMEQSSIYRALTESNERFTEELNKSKVQSFDLEESINSVGQGVEKEVIEESKKRVRAKKEEFEKKEE